MAISWSYEDLRADGVSLKNYGFGISLVGGLSAVPAKTGSNVDVAYKRGTLWRPKTFTEVVRQLTMWIDARDPDTGLYPATWMGRVAQRNENMLQLMRILGKTDSLIRFDRDIVLGSGTTQTWFGHGEYVNDVFAPNWGDNSDEETNFSVDLRFPDPFWYAPLVTSSSIAAGSSATVNNTGDLDAFDCTITISATASLVNPVLTNTTNNVSVRLGTTINAGDSVTIETKYPRVRHSNGANLIGVVSNSGARSFMVLARGANTLQLTASSGTGSAVVTFYPPHF